MLNRQPMARAWACSLRAASQCRIRPHRQAIPWRQLPCCACITTQAMPRIAIKRSRLSKLSRAWPSNSEFLPRPTGSRSSIYWKIQCRWS